MELANRTQPVATDVFMALLNNGIKFDDLIVRIINSFNILNNTNNFIELYISQSRNYSKFQKGKY